MDNSGDPNVAPLLVSMAFSREQPEALTAVASLLLYNAGIRPLQIALLSCEQGSESGQGLVAPSSVRNPIRARVIRKGMKNRHRV